MHRIAFRLLLADDSSLASTLAEEVTEALNTKLPGPYQLIEKGPVVHERSHGFVSFERSPASAWNKVTEIDGIKQALTGSLLFILEYDTELKSKSPSGNNRSDWSVKGGDPNMQGTEVPFVLEVGYFKRKYGMGFSDETRTEVGLGDIIITDSHENMNIEFEDITNASQRIVEFIDGLLSNPPAGAMEPLKGKARQRSQDDI
jgi:hypothetical protein